MNRRVRNWIRVAVGVILLLAVLIVPRSETEIHKRKCQAAWDRLTEKSFIVRVKRYYHDLMKTTPSDSYNDDYLQWCESRQALIDVGYLVQQRFVMKGGPATAAEAFHKERPEDAFVWADREPNHVLVITAPRSEMVSVSNTVRKIEASLR